MPLGKRADYGDAKFVGCSTLSFVKDIEPPLQDAQLAGFDFILAPLTRSDYRPPTAAAAPPFDKADVLYLSSTKRITQVVGCLSVWIEPDSEEAGLRAQSMATLKAELAWAAHLSLQAVLLPPITSPSVSNYAHGAHTALNSLSHMALWLTVPLSPDADKDDSSWERWNAFRTMTDFHNLLGCALEIGRELPPHKMIERWSGEPLKAVLLPTHVFGSNKRGYPILTKRHQEAVQAFFRMGVQIVVMGKRVHAIPVEDVPGASSAPPPLAPPPSGGPPGLTLASFLPPLSSLASDPPLGFTITNPGDNHELKSYHDYLSFLFRKMGAVSDQDQAESEYRDYLQAPLQPLQDNLESATYEVFEKDQTKYSQYEEAIYHALIDRVREGSEQVTTVMVVGAGRGPLIRSAFKASNRSRRKIAVWAVEKNPNAIIHIQAMLKQEGWEDLVTLVFSDMRQWQAPNNVLADILVSELLGSFGDNELSPECLDGCTRFLKTDAISIPQSYISFLAPVTSHKLYNTVKDYKDLEHFETPYVVKFHRHTLLSDTLPVFQFDHPNWSSPVNNTRYARLQWPRPKEVGSAVVHGFAGYFECTLYKSVTLNIHPPTHTPNMFSWFPIFFPLREPVFVRAGETIEACFWRCCGSHKVWYEWSLGAPSPGPVHNVGGRSYFVGLG
jgi:protein arginine N-methyltransferase 5